MVPLLYFNFSSVIFITIFSTVIKRKEKIFSTFISILNFYKLLNYVKQCERADKKVREGGVVFWVTTPFLYLRNVKLQNIIDKIKKIRKNKKKLYNHSIYLLLLTIL